MVDFILEDESFQNIKETLEKFNKYNYFESILHGVKDKINNFEEPKKTEWNNFINNKQLKLEIEYIPKPEPYNYNLDYENDEKLLISLKKLFPIKNIDFKPCREILGKKEIVILPDKIDYRHFNQGKIKDCYFISCISALSQIPQLLNFIMGLTSEEYKNKNGNIFCVNFFIDGKWQKVYVKDSFPYFVEDDCLIGVHPNDNELFMMILEKAWAQINGGYDQIGGGYNENIFELFLGSICNTINHDNDENNMLENIIYNAIKDNENEFGTLSLCSAKYYKLQNQIKECIGYHSYRIVKTLELNINKNKNKFDTFKFIIISNPHGRGNLIDSGIDLIEIKEILENDFGLENKEQYQYYLDKNDQYEQTGKIFMPLKYYKKWSVHTNICNPHYDCISYEYDIKDELQFLYIFKIKLKESQIITCQTCFQSDRAHRDKIDKVNIYMKNGNELYSLIKKLLLNFNFSGINIIKNDENLTLIKTYSSYNNNPVKTSIKELNANLDSGEYFFMIYTESSINECIIRFLADKEIEINLINKFDVMQKKHILEFGNLLNEVDIFIYYRINKSTENIFSNLFNESPFEYKIFINDKDFGINNEINIAQKKDIFLPGIKEYYKHFKFLAEEKGLEPDEAIYSITENGEAMFYDIFDPNSLHKIYGERSMNGEIKSDFIDIKTLEFRDNFGYPIKVDDYKELIKLMKINRSPLSCLFSDYDDNTNVLSSGSVYLKLYKNKAKNEDILVITDIKGIKIKRQHKPLFIIIIDISGSMRGYSEYLQNQVIPKLLKRLGYIWESKEKELYNNLYNKNISNLELLQAISNKYKLENFKNRYKEEIDLIENINLKKFCDNIIPLITFSDNSEIYFYSVSDFEKGILSGGATYFKEAALHLTDLLKTISKERSIRLLSFSDGVIYDIEKSIGILNTLLETRKVKHQMNSVSVRVYNGAEPDTKILMKLSEFSYPINDMTQIVINLEKGKVDDVVQKLYLKFKEDDMEYNLKLISDNIFTSNDFSNNFSKEQYFNNVNTVFRVEKQHDLSQYINHLKCSIGNMNIEDIGELEQEDFYKIMSKNTPFISQRILERKVNGKNNSEQNEEIIDYFKTTENYLEKNSNNKKNNSKKKKIYEIFEEINNNAEVNWIDHGELAKYIEKIKDKTNNTVDIINKDYIKDEYYIKYVELKREGLKNIDEKNYLQGYNIFNQCYEYSKMYLIDAIKQIDSLIYASICQYYNGNFNLSFSLISKAKNILNIDSMSESPISPKDNIDIGIKLYTQSSLVNLSLDFYEESINDIKNALTLIEKENNFDEKKSLFKYIIYTLFNAESLLNIIKEEEIINNINNNYDNNSKEENIYNIINGNNKNEKMVNNFLICLKYMNYKILFNSFITSASSYKKDQNMIGYYFSLYNQYIIIYNNIINLSKDNNNILYDDAKEKEKKTKLKELKKKLQVCNKNLFGEKMASNLLKNNESIYNLLKYFNNKMKCSSEIFSILEKYEKELVNFYSIKDDKAKYKNNIINNNEKNPYFIKICLRYTIHYLFKKKNDLNKIIIDNNNKDNKTNINNINNIVLLIKELKILLDKINKCEIDISSIDINKIDSNIIKNMNIFFENLLHIYNKNILWRNFLKYKKKLLSIKIASFLDDKNFKIISKGMNLIKINYNSKNHKTYFYNVDLDSNLLNVRLNQKDLHPYKSFNLKNDLIKITYGLRTQNLIKKSINKDKVDNETMKLLSKPCRLISFVLKKKVFIYTVKMKRLIIGFMD